MPRNQTTTPTDDAVNNQLTPLATQLKREMAEYRLRIANYFTPFGFDPEQADFDRAGDLLDQHGIQLADTVFHQSSPQLKDRVTHSVTEYHTRKTSFDALVGAGAEDTMSNVDAFTHARSRVFQGNTGSRAA